jgi:hypothetical protein
MFMYQRCEENAGERKEMEKKTRRGDDKSDPIGTFLRPLSKSGAEVRSGRYKVLGISLVSPLQSWIFRIFLFDK